MSAGFVGGGGRWVLEVALASGQIDIWAAQWDVENANAPDDRIWKVTYFLIAQQRFQSVPNVLRLWCVVNLRSVWTPYTRLPFEKTAGDSFNVSLTRYTP